MKTLRELEIAKMEIEEKNDRLLAEWYIEKLGSRYGNNRRDAGAEGQAVPDGSAGQPVYGS